MTGQELVTRWQGWLTQFVGLSEAQALVVVLWAMHTWYADRFGATPYLEVSASTKRSGKTTLLEALSMVCQNAKMFATVRMLTVVRMIEAYEGRVTMLFDEAERLSAATLGDTRSMLAVGYRKGQNHAVSVGSKFQEFPTYCPKAFALIGNVTGVLRDRSIPIELERRMPPVSLTNNRDAALEQAQSLIVDLKSVMGRVDRIPLITPEWLTGRERELWTPLLSLAHALQLHKATIEQLQAASVDLGVLKTLPPKEWHSAQDEQAADDTDAAEKALADLKTVLQEGEKAIPSAVAVERLRGIPTSPWRAWRGDGLNELTLAALLSRYGIAPKVIRFGKGRKDSKLLRGYAVSDLHKRQA